LLTHYTLGTKFEDGVFDYIRQRALRPAIPMDLWTEHAKECYRISRKGAIVEWIESDHLLRPSGPAIDRLNIVLTATATYLGWAVDLTERLPDAMHAAGLRGIETRRVRVPVGSWSKNPTARISWQDYCTSVHYLANMIEEACGVDAVRLEQLLAAVEKEVEERHATISVFVFWGRHGDERLSYSQSSPTLNV
jgi:hypothetical protein